MKMNPTMYAELKAAIERVLAEHPETTPEVFAINGISPRGFRWDVMWRAQRDGYFNVGDLYHADLNDEHIDTALRRITGTN